MSLRRTRILVPLLAVSLAGVAAFAPPAAAQSKSDKAILKAGVITKADVPEGWTSKKSSDSTPERGIANCKKIRAATDNAKKKAARAVSREFDDPGTDAHAENTVYALKDSNAASKLVSVYQDADALSCFEKVAKKTVGSRGEVAVSPIADLQGVGDEAVGYEIVITPTTGAQSTPLYIDQVLVRVGRTAVGFAFANAGERTPIGPPVVQAVVARVAAAQGSA
jgi:hypothetical protein